MLHGFDGILKIGYELQIFRKIFWKVWEQKKILCHLGRVFNKTECTLQG